MKHFHTLLALLVILLFLYQSYRVLIANKRAPRPIKIANHIFYLLIIGSGAWLLMYLLDANAPVQWVIAKIILLIAAISATVKAYSYTATKSQSRVGILIAAIAYTGILILAYVKPENLF